MEPAKLKFINHEQISIGFVKTEKGYMQYLFNTDDRQIGSLDIAAPCFQLALSGKPVGQMISSTMGYTIVPEQMVLEDIFENDYGFTLKYLHYLEQLEVRVNIDLIPGTSVFKSSVIVTNKGSEKIILTNVSSLFMCGIATEGIRTWFDDKKIKVHYCLNTWQGEGQWRQGSLEEIGIYPTSTHNNYSTFKLNSVGSHSTAKYLPICVIEDIETGKSWFFQIETSSAWNYELGFRGNGLNCRGSLFACAGGADQQSSGWYKELQPNESYETVPVSAGCCAGGFDEAIKQLTKYKRYLVDKNKLKLDTIPIVYNDYMNTLWGNPTDKNLIPLIDAASKAGAEYFCIDAGWFGDIGSGGSWGTNLGDWVEGKNRFGDLGLKGIINYIAEKGMKPGIWLEMEICNDKAPVFNKPDSWFLCKNGKRIITESRYFLNYYNKDVKRYMEDVIRDLYNMGIRFIKNDYNESVGIGCDINGSSYSEGFYKHIMAFYIFIDEIRYKYKDLVLENCGSGALRQDYGILSHFHIQSTSDQQIYTKYPSIIAGQLAALLPEQAGIWSYPMPNTYENKDNLDLLNSDGYKSTMKDGEQTIFNMINGFCGCMYLSGHINLADDYNFSLIKEGISLYKENRDFIKSAYPIWPNGFARINNNNTWISLGLISDIKDRMLLAVWRLNDNNEYFEIPLSIMATGDVKVNLIYPKFDKKTKYYYNNTCKKLIVKLNTINTARLFEVTSEN